jgi:hypothetical protein
MCHINIHTYHRHKFRIKCGACHHIHLGCHSTPFGGYLKHLCSIGWHLQYKTDLVPLNPITRHRPSKIAGPLSHKGRPIRHGDCWGEGEDATLRSRPSSISLHQQRRNDRRCPPFVLYTARRRPTTRSPPSYVLIQPGGPRGIRPIITGPARRSVLRARFVMAFL